MTESMTTSLDLAWIAYTPTEISAAVEAALAIKKAGFAAVKVVPAAQRTFANTIGALEHAGERATDLQQQLEFLAVTHPDEPIRSAAQAGAQTLERENVLLSYDHDLWRAMQEWEALGEQLDPAERKLASDSIRDMRRMGFSLPPEQFERLKAVSQELGTLASEFERGIAEYEDSITVTREQLEGLPENFTARLTKDADGRYRIGLDYPTLGPFMQYAHDDGARRELNRKRWRKGGPENLARLQRLIELRQEQARLLGYATHADYVTEVRMVKNAAAVEQFLGGIITKLAPAVRVELRDLVDIKRRTLGLEKPAPIHGHETAYWSNLLRKERYDLDTEEVRHHFPADHVLAGMMELYQELLGLRFTAVSGAPLWHSSAQLYAVHDAATGRSVGHFALDLYPRTGKYDHYAAFPIALARERIDGTRVEGFVGLVCNFPPPTKAVPSLLSHYEVEVLFHEFGHVMHALVSGGRWQRQNGFATAMDFIEAPSQIFEYWTWSPQVLARISKHYKTGQPISQALVAKMLRARQFMQASEFNNQAVKALYDLRMHTQATDAPVQAEALAALHRSLVFEYERMEMPDDAIFAAGWSHMADYDAGYYGYLWSKVYAADMFTRFAADPLAHVVGADYRAQVLAPGATRPELDLVRAFLGREPSDAAFLSELGIS